MRENKRSSNLSLDKRLKSLEEVFHSVASGNFSGNIEVPDQNDELYPVFSGVKMMQEKIREYIDLQEKVNNNLEQLVAAKHSVLESTQRIARIGSWGWDAETGITILSEEMCRILAIDPDKEFMDAEWMLSHLHEDDRQTLEIDLPSILDKGGKHQRDIRLFDQKGTMKYLRIIAEIELDKSGLIRIQGTAQDITQSEDQFKDTLNGAPVPILILDFKEHKIIYANKEAEMLLDMPAESLLGNSVMDFLDKTIDRPEFTAIFRDLTAQEIHELSLNRPDGRPIEIQASIKRTSFQNKDAIIAVINDITARKRNENKFRDLLESAPDAMIIFNTKGKIALVNRQTENHFGYCKSDLMGKPIEMLFEKEKRAEYRDKIRDYIESQTKKGESSGFELNGLTKGGKHFPAEISFSKIETEDELLIAASIWDLTESKETERALKESEVHWRTLVENTPDVITRYDKNLRYVFVNSTYEKETGRQSSEVVGKSQSELGIPPEIEGPFSEKLRRVFNTGVGESYYTSFGKDEKRVFLYSRIVPEFNRKKKVETVLTITTDITERKMAEEALKEARENLEKKVLERTEELSSLNERLIIEISERKKIQEASSKLADIVKYSEDAILSMSLEGKIKSWNKGAEKIFGYTEQEALGKSISLILPEDKKGEFGKNLEKIKAGKTIVSFESLRVRKGNKLIPVSVTQSPIKNSTGEVIGVSTIDRDISEYKQALEALQVSESKYRSLIETMSEGVLVVDNEDHITFVNRKFCEMTEYYEEELLGLEASSLLLRTEDREMLDNKMEKRRTGKTDQCELRIKTKSGHEKWVLISSTPVYDFEGNITGSLGVHSDITHLKKSEEELLKAKHAAEHSAKAKEQFLANISHEIRTPMNAIMGMVQLMKKTPLNEKQVGYIKSMNFATDNLLSLINDVLDLSRIEAGKIKFEEVEFNPREVMESLMDTYDMKAREKDLGLNLIISDEVPHRLLGDPIRLTQICANLISNAIKFTEKGKISVFIEEKRRRKNRSSLVFRIEDTGIGIEKDKRKLIFESFEQANTDTSRKYGGTGLGLSIVKQLVELQGGIIQLQSEIGIGTVFYFTLDYMLVNEYENKKIKPVIARDSDAEKNLISGAKVLLVEDNDINQLVIEEFLKQWNIITEVAENGRLAIDRLKKNSFDLILMDIQMPEMDGYETTTYIRKNFDSPVKDIPILAMTAHAFQQEREKCLSLGMNDYISKPLKAEDLYEKIVSLLSEQRVTTT